MTGGAHELVDGPVWSCRGSSPRGAHVGRHLFLWRKKRNHLYPTPPPILFNEMEEVMGDTPIFDRLRDDRGYQCGDCLSKGYPAGTFICEGCE